MESSTTPTRNNEPTGDDSQPIEESGQLRPSTAMVTELQDLPDNVLVQIFRHATEYELAGHRDTRTITRMRGVSRITLKNVCWRWRILNESSTCITLPEELWIFTFEKVSLRRAINKLNDFGALPGPISIVVRFQFDPFERLSKQDGIAHIDMLARALSVPHKAALFVAFQDVPLNLVQRLLANGSSKIVNFVISPSSPWIVKAAHLTACETLPQKMS